MPRNVSKAAKRLSKWRADTCQALSRAACGDTLADTVRAILRKTANIFKTIKDDAFDEEQRGQLSRELVTVLCQVSSNLHFRARDLLLSVESVDVTTRFDYWGNQCALLSYVLDLALALNEPSAIAKILFTLSKNKHRVWDVLVQTEAIASTAALDERDRVLDVFRWLTAYCPRTCSNPEHYFKFIACAACLSRRLHERGWKTVKPTALTIEPAKFDFEEWFAAQPALVVLLPPCAGPRPRRKVIAQLCKSASSHAELLKACEAISEPGGGPGPNIRSACDAEATTEDDFFTIVDDGMEAREQETTTPKVEDQQLQVILESTLCRIHSDLASPRMADYELNSELISEASISPLNTRAFLDKLLSGASVGCSTSAALDIMQKPGKRLDYVDKELLKEASGLDGRAANKGDGSKGGTQKGTASGDESCVETSPGPVDSPHEIEKQSRKKKVLVHKATLGETASSVTETVQECGMPSAITVGSEEGEPPSLQLPGRKRMETEPSISAVETLDASTLCHDERTPLMRTKRYSSTDDSLEKELRDQEIAKVNGKLLPVRERREAPRDSSSSQVRPIAEEIKTASEQRSSGHTVGKPSLRESKGKLKGQSDSESEAVAEAVANCHSRASGARKKAEQHWVIDSSEEESRHEECLEESSAHLPSDDADEMPLCLVVEAEGKGPCSGPESASSEVRPSAGAVKAASPQRSRGCTAGKVASPKATGKLEGQLGSAELESGTEAVLRRSSKGRGLRKPHQHIIKNSSKEGSCGEQNVEEDDMHSASDGAGETTSSSSAAGKALSSVSHSEFADLQARPSEKVVMAASMWRQSSHFASSNEDESAEEAVSDRSSRACGARKAQRHRISDSSGDDSCSERILEDGVHLASDNVEVPSSSSDSESGSKGSPRPSVKKRTATLLSSCKGAASIGRRTVHKGNKLNRSRISSSSEEESQVRCASERSAKLSAPRRTRKFKESSGSEHESPEENLDQQIATSSLVRKSATGTSSLASNGRAGSPSPNLHKAVSRVNKEHRNRIGELSQQEPHTSQVSKGNYKTLASERTCRFEMSSGSESDLPLSQNAPSQTVKKVRRSRIVSLSESESSDDEHDAEVSVQPDTPGHEVPSDSDNDKIPCGQRSPNIPLLQRIRISSPDSESEKGPCALKLRRKRRLAAESDADTVDMLSGDEEVLSGKQSSACLSQTSTVAASPERRSASPFLQPRGAQTSQATGANQGSAENSVFKLPTLKKACTVSAHREAQSKSQDELGGLDKHVASGSSPYERSTKGKTEPVAGTTLSRRTLTSRRSEPSQDENLAKSYQGGVTELGSGDTGFSASDAATASRSLNCSAPVLEDVLRVQSEAISSDRKKASPCEENCDALNLHDAHADANEASALGTSAIQCSLKTEQTVAREGPQVNGKTRTSPRKCSTSGPFRSEVAVHEMSSECDTDISRSGKELSFKRVVQNSSTKSACGVQVSSVCSSEVSDDDIELESPQKYPCSLSNEKRTSPMTRQKLGAYSEESGAGKSERAGPNSLQKSPSSLGKHDDPAKLIVHTRNTRRQLLANASASLSPKRNEVAKCVRAERPGKAPGTLEQTSSSEQADVTESQESPRKRPCPASPKKKWTSSGSRQKSGTSLEMARACRSEQLAPGNHKSPSSPVKDDIPARVLTRSARKQQSRSKEASVSAEKNRVAKSSRAERQDKATDTLDAASAWEGLRNTSEEVLDSDAESGMSSVIDHSPSVAAALSSAVQGEKAVLVEERLNERKVVGESKRHSTRLHASQTGFCTTLQLRLRSTKNEVEAVVPVANSRELLKVHLDSDAVQNESIAMSGTMREHPKQCSTQDLSQSSSNLDGLTQAPSSPPLRLSADLPSFQREADASQWSQREVQQLDKKGCAVNTVEMLYSSFVSLGDDSGDDTADLAESRGLSPLSQNKESPMMPKLGSGHHRVHESGTRKSGRLSLTAIRSSQSEVSEHPISSPPVSNRRAVTDGELEQPTLITATHTRRSSSARASSPDSKKQASEAKKIPTRASALRGSQNSTAAEASASLSQQFDDATDTQGRASAKALATRRSARLSLMSSSLDTQAHSSRLTAVAQEEGNPSDADGEGRLTRSRSVRTTPSSKDHNAAHSRTPPVRVALDRLQDVTMTRRRSSDACSACQRSSPTTQNSGTMTDESYLHDEADFLNSSASTKRRKTDRRSVAATTQQKSVTSTHRSSQCSTVTQQPSAPVRRSTRTAVSVSRRLSYA